jgi:hypothetical protein
LAVSTPTGPAVRRTVGPGVARWSPCAGRLAARPGACGRSAGDRSRAGDYQGGQRDARVVPAGHRHHESVAAAPPGAALGQVSAPGRTRLRRPARRPGPPPSFYHGPGLLPPRGNPVFVPLGGPAGWNLHGPPEPVQQHVNPGQRVLHPRTAARPGPWSGPGSSTDPYTRRPCRTRPAGDDRHGGLRQRPAAVVR